MSALLVILLGLGLAVMQLLIGGVKMVYSLPAYALIGLAGIVTLVWWRKHGAAKPIGWCLGSAALLAAYIGARAFASPVDYLARNDAYLILGSLLVYLIVAFHLVSPRLRLALLWILFALLLSHVFVGIVQFKEKQNFMLLPWILRSDYGYRASGFYICPNHLAGLLEMVGMLALSLTLWGRGKTWTRIVAAYVAIMALVGIAITGSRGGYLSFVAGLMAFGLLSLIVIRLVKRRWFWGAVLIAFVGCAGLVGSSVWAMRKSTDLERRLGQINDPKNMRLLMWKAALDAHRLSPWMGTGAGTYLFYGRHFRSQQVQNDPQHVHNDYLELLAEYGIVGCALMAVFIATHIGSGFAAVIGIIRIRLKPFGLTRSNELAILLGALSGLAAIAAHSVVDFNLHIPANALVAACLFGILANPRTPPPEEQVRWRIDSIPLRITPALAGIAAVAFATPRIFPEYCAERARMALRDQMPADAIRYTERAMRHDPRNPALYYYLGESKHMLSLAEKDPAARSRLQIEAAQAFAAGLPHFPADLNLLLKLARALDNLQRFSEAEFVFRLALDADPNLSTVYSYYGYHYYLQRRLIRAEKLYQKAYELGDRELARAGLEDVIRYRFRASQEETETDYPIEDQPGDEEWEPGQP